ncbi:LOW QUALITY PROTEIN: EVE domain [Dillenia turbinata]|uniref:EVE domain n=1 Tax=Dillenia turbinata TaxID=194707 RepID=A0AAN8UH54_9MAGN
MKAMKLNDLCFFYHSSAKLHRIVGIVEVVCEWYEDDESGGGCIDMKAIGEIIKGIDLQEMKRESGLKDFVLFRLSVVPVGEDLWVKICEMGGGYEEDGGGAKTLERSYSVKKQKKRHKCSPYRGRKIQFYVPRLEMEATVGLAEEKKCIKIKQYKKIWVKLIFGLANKLNRKCNNQES